MEALWVLSALSRKKDEGYIYCNGFLKKTCASLALVLRCDNADYLCELRCEDTEDGMKVIEPWAPTYKTVVEAVGDDRTPISGAGDEQDIAKFSSRIPGGSRTLDARAIFRSS